MTAVRHANRSPPEPSRPQLPGADPKARKAPASPASSRDGEAEGFAKALRGRLASSVSGNAGTQRMGPVEGAAPPAEVPEAPQAATASDESLEPEPHRQARDEQLDPLTRQAAQLAPPIAMSSPASATPNAVEVRARVSLEEVLPALVKRIAWSGDGRRGQLRLEFGAGSLAGGTLVVHADDGHVRVELTAPAGVDAADWKERITSRLRRRGLMLDDVRVD